MAIVTIRGVADKFEVQARRHSPRRREEAPAVFRSRFFWRIYLANAVLVVVTAGVVGFLTQRLVLDNLNTQIQTRLQGTAAALGPLGERAFSGADRDQVQASIERVGVATRSRITLIDAAGLVLADSSEDPGQMANHADRPEFIEAMRSGDGIAQRFSTTLQLSLLYVARAVDSSGERAGVIRVSIPLAEIDAQRAGLRNAVLQGGAVGILLALGLGVVVARRFTAPIAEMSRVSEALRSGDYSARVRATRGDEVGILGDNLDRLADELTARLGVLGQQRAQLDAFIGAMQEGIIAVDQEGRIVFSNHVGRRLLQVKPDSLIDEVRRDLPKLDALLDRVDATGEPHSDELVVRDGEDELVLDARVAPISAQETRGMVLVFYDITNLRRLERVRTDFVANVSHELKTPLTSIQGYVETLLDGAVHDDEANVRFLEKIDVQVARLTALVSDLLSLAKIESDTTASATSIDGREVVMDSIARRRDPIAARQLTLDVELPSEHVWLEADPEALRQIVDNLLDNAINYTPAGGRLWVELVGDEQQVTLAIGDTGIGIPTDALDRIFERFYRVDRGRSRRLGGTGLGLSIVRNLVQRMGGTIEVESSVGEGSVFRVTLPPSAVTPESG